MMRGITAIAAAAIAALTFTAVPAQAGESTASPYAFQAAPGCLGLHTGVGIDAYIVDGLRYDVPNTNEVRTITFNETGGLQGDYRVVALPGYTPSNVTGAQFVSVYPGAGCPAEESEPATETAANCSKSDARVDALRKRLDRKDARIEKLRKRIERLRDRLN
jgi:hypothetical protein